MQYKHTTVLYSIATACHHVIIVFSNIISGIFYLKIPNFQSKFFNKWKRFLVLPIIICFIFFILYSTVNGVLLSIVANLVNNCFQYITHFFNYISFESFSFFIFCFQLACVLIAVTSNTTYFNKEQQQYLVESRLKPNKYLVKQYVKKSFFAKLLGKYSNSTLALKHSATVGTISFVFLNILLLFFNYQDVKYIWLPKQIIILNTMVTFVHEGTYTLIFTIVLAIGIVVAFFKGNINFYKGNKWLQYTATIWLVQNALLTLSVGKRVMLYIQIYGLAYRRIAVLFFLLATFVGLITVLIKIYNKKTIFYLLTINTWFIAILLTITTTLNWDKLIAIYNIKNCNTVQLDVPFLLTLSSATIPILESNLPILVSQYKVTDEQYQFDREINQDVAKKLIATLANKKQTFLTEQKLLSWYSWNYNDAQLYNILKSK